MSIKTQAEQFAPLLAGRYTGQPATLWRQLQASWCGNLLSDEHMDITCRETDGVSLDDNLSKAIESRDHVTMLVLIDQAEEAGIDPELCDMTRRALKVQYPS